VVMTIVQTKPQRVRVSVAEKQRAEVQAGLAAKIEPTSRPGVQLAGKVESIAAVPAADGAFKAAVSVDADPGQLVPGMTCKVKLVTFFRPDALSAPAKSVFADDGGGRYVLLVTGEGQHERRDVQVGKTVGDRVEIAGGLAEGDSILTSKPN